MAQRKTKVSSTAPSIAPKTAEERRQYMSREEINALNFAAAKNALKQFRDVTKNSTKTISTFNKESLRTYLQNIGSNEKNLRNLSRYLYYRSQVYYRLIMYNATMMDFNARSVIPNVDSGNTTKIYKSYQETLAILDRMNLPLEMLRATTIAFREDVFYGCAFYDETGMFVLPLDPDYCKISGQYQTGDFSFAMDMSYYRSRQTELEMLGEPFTSMYRAYGGNNANRWQPMPDEYAICLKVRAEDWETVVPPYTGLFNQLIGLCDIEDIQAIADEEDIYKMIYFPMGTISGAKSADEWAVNPDLCIQYMDRLAEDVPDYTAVGIVPGKLETISFNDNKTNDVNRIAKTTETTLNSAGGAQILNSSTISGTTAFTAAIKSDSAMAISSLLRQIQAWVNRFLLIQNKNAAKVKFFDVTIYTKEEFKKTLLNDAQYGVTSKLAINTLNGFSESETLALNFLEEEVLKLSEKFKPLQSSHTQSGTSLDSTGGRPKSDTPTDESEADEEKQDNKK